MGLWISEHQRGEGFGLTKILLFIAVGIIVFNVFKK